MSGGIAFIGGGVMASALLDSPGIKGKFAPQQIQVVEPAEQTRARHEQAGLRVHATAEGLEPADAYMLCVKPQDMEAACAALRASGRLGDQPVVSIAAGQTVASLRAWLGAGQLVRTMPNLPLLASEGCTFAYSDQPRPNSAGMLAELVFDSCGALHWVDDEELIDAATALSGSGPAYCYLVLEQMAATATRLGIDKPTALAAAVQTMRGACAMVDKTAEDPAALKQEVASKGGTTAAALAELERLGFAAALDEAMAAAWRRAGELAGKPKD